LVLSPLGATINGSHSWILLGGGFAVQPSEFAKVGLVLITDMLLAQPVDGTDRPRGLDVLLALVAAGITLGLVMFQPDLGTALVLAAITASARSEEHTSELQSRENLVCRLLLEK